jgi:SAM-dependent methyltransferase
LSVETGVAPPALRIFELTFDALVGARVCYAAVKLRIPDLLAKGPRTSDELAHETGAHPRALYRLLRALSVVGLVDETPGQTFSLTDLGAALRSDVPGSMRSWVEFCGDPYYLQAWAQILHSVQTGRPAFDHVHGKPFFDYLAAHPAESHVFDNAMTSLTSNDAPEIVAAYDFRPFERVIDVGGGKGTLLLEILQANERAVGVLFDQPHVTEGIAERIAELGLTGRCTVESGDFFTQVPTGGDAYVLKFILHDWDDSNCARILSSCRRAIAPGGKLLAIETLVPPPGVPGHSKLDDIEMMVLLGSQERTEEEYGALLDSSSFRLARVVPVNWIINVIEAEPV